MEWTLIASLAANAFLVYSLVSTRNELKQYKRFTRDLTHQMEEMKEIIGGYDRVIHKERAQLQYILLGYMLPEEILELKNRFRWLEELQDELEQKEIQKTE